MAEAKANNMGQQLAPSERGFRMSWVCSGRPGGVIVFPWQVLSAVSEAGQFEVAIRLVQQMRSAGDTPSKVIIFFPEMFYDLAQLRRKGWQSTSYTINNS